MFRLQGNVVKITSTPYDFAEEGTGRRVSGVSHVARIDQGRGDYEDVKVPDALLQLFPQDSAIPDGGVAVDLDVEFQKKYGRIALVGQHVERAAAGKRALATA